MNQTPTEFILGLARSFPCLETKLRGWNPKIFDADAFHYRTRGWSSSERQSAHFVLTVWNPSYARQRGWTFDLVDAVSLLDSANRTPLLAWIARPYYP
jgi:hypothetical protein